MNSTTWKKLKNYFVDDREDYYAVPAAEENIKTAENILELKFSDSYKKFLSLYGGAMISGDLVYGLSYQVDMDKDTWSVVDKTKFYKEVQKWPGIEDWYIISDDGRGNPIGVDPAGKVWLSDHDSNFEKVKLADNFEEFLEKLLNDSLYE